MSQRGKYTVCGLKLSAFTSGKTKEEAGKEASAFAVGDRSLCKHCERIEKQDSDE